MTVETTAASDDVSVSGPAPATPVAMRERIKDIGQADDRFTPAWYLPTKIDFFTDAENPYSLMGEVRYFNGHTNVRLREGFKWDGASIPTWTPVVPWIVTMILMQLWPTWWLWLITVALMAYTIRLLPYLQKMGLHARASAVHDRLCRTQKITRLEADAIFMSILESDGVPWDVRWLMYRRVRQFGWINWMKNKAALKRANAGPAVVNTKPPVLAIHVAYWIVFGLAVVSLLIYLIGRFFETQ